MSITVKLHSMLRTSHLAEKETTVLPYRANLTIKEIIEQLKIPVNVVGVILCDGILTTDLDLEVSDGGTIELYPIFGGG